MLKRLASVAAASLLACAAVFGSTGTTAASAGQSWETKVATPGVGDLVQPTSGHNWE